jgi:protein-tyrosine-phosphatase
MKVTALLPQWLSTLLKAAIRPGDRHDLVWELRRRWSGEPSLPPGPIQNIMVICYGNICRSPFAQLHLAALCPHLEIRSAGLEAGDRKPVEPGALRVGRELGVELTDHASHRLDADDVDWADLIIGMQGRHKEVIRKRWSNVRGKVRLLGDFLPNAPHSIEDPWGESDEVFRSILERIVNANEILARRLCTEGEGS